MNGHVEIKFGSRRKQLFEKTKGIQEIDKEKPDKIEIQKSIEGYVIFVTGLNEETNEDDMLEHFNDYGTVSDHKFVLDRRTGFSKGYCLVEYKALSEAQEAIQKGNGSELLENTLTVSWAFKPPNKI